MSQELGDFRLRFEPCRVGRCYFQRRDVAGKYICERSVVIAAYQFLVNNIFGCIWGQRSLLLFNRDFYIGNIDALVSRDGVENGGDYKERIVTQWRGVWISLDGRAGKLGALVPFKVIVFFSFEFPSANFDVNARTPSAHFGPGDSHRIWDFSSVVRLDASTCNFLNGT